MNALSSEMLACRPLLRAHCYRMLGHPEDAEDAVQDTFVRAVRGSGGFEGRAAARTWLVSIATRVCLDALARRKSRRMPTSAPPGTPAGPFEATLSDEWIAPAPDTWMPDEALGLSRRVDLALVTVLGTLPPRQRAALLLAEGFDWSANEIARALETSTASVTSALQRARAALGRGVPGRPTTDPQLVARYREAFRRYDVDALVDLLSDDIRFDMPPIPLWLRGPQHVHEFLLGPGAACRGSSLVPLRSAGLEGFAQYRNQGQAPWAIVLLETRDGRVSGVHNFLDVDALFPLFGLPSSVSEQEQTG